ncbi:hypothetical protein HMPREF0972_01402 [Actinomyces sp. oral taxon 848 str. F0332]|nr:hypothetical protein HMPREF0972_01402 [Actinomyces sp. oral taxon 848 str. F0332]
MYGNREARETADAFRERTHARVTRQKASNVKLVSVILTT